MLDAGFLQAEDSDRHVSLAIGAISVLAGPMPDFDSLATGLHPDERAMGRGCITCHANIHGSNAPSGPKFHE